MIQPIRLRHLFTNKHLTIINKQMLGAILHGDAAPSANAAKVAATFVVLNNVPQPIPVVETEEEILNKMGYVPTNEETR